MADDVRMTLLSKAVFHKAAWISCLLLVLILAGIGPALANTALVLRAPGDDFSEVVNGMSDDLEGDIGFAELVVDAGSRVSDVAAQIKTHQPKVIVLIGNSSVNLYTKYQQAFPGQEFPPSIALAALFVDKFIPFLKNATGIRYEIPLVTSVVNMRLLMEKPIKKVGVVYRSWMQDIFDENVAYCRAEGIELIGGKLPNKDRNMNRKIKQQLQGLINQGVDVIWLLNDNQLINQKALKKVWLPLITRSKLPVIVGIKSLLATKLNLGSFAIVPDHYGLGVQASSVLLEIMENDWKILEQNIEHPLSVKQIVNVTILNKRSIQYRENLLSQVDDVIN
ncbi:hypothetical protein SG34_026400 [Thalassomonas viridans]|uniref:Uncharacterized protein n=1 Tax=Thalassomonas viridans TaxID=137584 RepID=A0AAE9Z450_9GAMM|nr:ABC transporter substrate binding protein [Thalassomonas viridans]WDE04802.1 hypothetical protein SG34_026400 [Thalassomonas viridans]